MNYTSYIQFGYDSDDPDEVPATQEPQAGSCSESVLVALEGEMAAQLARDAEQYTRQEQMEKEQVGKASAEQNIEEEMYRMSNAGQEINGKEEMFCALDIRQEMQVGSKGEDLYPKMAGRTTEPDGQEKACSMTRLKETAGHATDILDHQQNYEQESPENPADGPEESENNKAVQPMPADVFSDEVKTVLSGYTKGMDEMKSTLSGCKEDIEKINWAMIRLEKKFDSEILNAENRDSAVKAVYKEMNEYKSGLVEKALKNVLYDIVDFRETMLSQIRFWREKKDIENISLKEFESYADDLADILERHDVTIYKGEPGQENTAVRQKIVCKVETEDDALVKKVAESLSYGYEYNSKVLYPEKISIYVKKK